MKRVLILGVTLVMTIGVFAGCSNKQETSTQQPTKVATEAAKPSEKDTDDDEPKKVEKLTDVKIREMAIKANDVLVKLYDAKNLDTNQVAGDTIGADKDSKFSKSLVYKSTDEVKKDLSTYFTDAYIDQTLTTEVIAKDGSVYIKLGDTEPKMDFSKCDIQVKCEIEGSNYKATFTSKDDTSNVRETTIAHKDDKWVFNIF